MSREFGTIDDIRKQISGEDLSKLPAPGVIESALAAIALWEEEWLAIVEDDAPKKFALSSDLKAFIERTNYLAHLCETLGLDASVLVRFAHNARRTYFAFLPTLVPVPIRLWVLLDRLKFRLRPIELRASSAQPLPVPTNERTTPIPDDEANILVKKFLSSHPEASARQVAKGVGIALGRVSRQPAWRSELGRRKANKPRVAKKERFLTRKMLDLRGKSDDPSAKMERDEAAWQRLLDYAKPQERAELHAKSPKERAKLIETALEQFADEMPADDCS